MKDINIHRNRKILMFQRNIHEFEAEIEKVRGYMNEKGNEDMTYYYENKIAELMEKIRENQQFINNLNKRIGAAAKSIHSSQPTSEKSVNSIESEKS
jgi:predicted RNase H-like nuclease (RuvC/YqgF family)